MPKYNNMLKVEKLKREIHQRIIDSRSQDDLEIMIDELGAAISFTKKAISSCLKSAKLELYRGDINTGCCEMEAAKENGEILKYLLHKLNGLRYK